MVDGQNDQGRDPSRVGYRQNASRIIMPPSSRPGGIIHSTSKRQRVSLAKSRAITYEEPPHTSAKQQQSKGNSADKFPYEILTLPALSRYLNPSAAMGLEQMVQSLLETPTDRLTDKTLLLENPVRAGSLSRQAGLCGVTREQFSLKLKKSDIVSRLMDSAYKLTFSQCLPLHELWRKQVGNQASAKLVQRQLIGSLVSVESCSSLPLVGKRGLVLAETKKAIVIITEHRDQLIALPRRRLSLTIEMPGGSLCSINKKEG